MIFQYPEKRKSSSTRLLVCCLLVFVESCLGRVTHATGESSHDEDSLQEQYASESFPGPAEHVLHSQQTPMAAQDEGISSTWGLGDLHGSSSTYTALLDALEVMQSHFFEVAHGTWPQAIDWTAAVMGTQVSATLLSMTGYTQWLMVDHSSLSTEQARDHENLINRYFTQITSFYFGENAFSLRTQAYDDMLWVVLGWLESIKFINLHSSLHYSPSKSHSYTHNGWWYARQFIPQYSHRAHLFYDLAARGWDTSLCGGGMTWNPHLAPYKNAITNQLFIAASVGMYLYFPGDNDPSPFGVPNVKSESGLPPAKAHDVRYLDNAVAAYKWLKGSGMRNEQGLYVDGFHIKGWRGGKNGSNGTGECDIRDNMVYTYNQGVLLSGLRGLWEATGIIGYLQDGHELVRNVITATGWADRDTDHRYRWAGLGRGGVMEEICDWSGSCSQNAQAFKGIFFHHLTLFCVPLTQHRNHEDDGHSDEQSWSDQHDAKILHRKSCDEYGDWIRHNAFAAYVTRNDNGEFGEWWGRAARRRRKESAPDEEPGNLRGPTSEESIDYRNKGVPRDAIWRLPGDGESALDNNGKQHELDNDRDVNRDTSSDQRSAKFDNTAPRLRDINDRGRGRTVETQSGGLAVLRAHWMLVASRVVDRDLTEAI